MTDSSKPSAPINRRSANITQGKSRAPNRSMYYAMGYEEGDFVKPMVGVANGQRVPEDWHRLSANALLHRAMKGGGSPAYRVDVNDVQLVLSGMQRQAAGLQGLHF